jgi:hypothetical protein
MKNPIRFLSAVGMMSLLTILPTQSFASPPKDGAVMCDKCKMVMVKVANPTSSKSPTVTYHDTTIMVCPDCHSAMENFFKTGKLKHTCTHCGGTMTICH